METRVLGIEWACGSIGKNKKARVGGNGKQHSDDAKYISPIGYYRNTSIMMRLEVNYLIIAPPTLKCSTV